MADRTTTATDGSRTAGPDAVPVLLAALSLADSGDSATLQALIIRRFGASSPRLESILHDYRQDVETYEKPAAKVLREAGVDRDQEVVDRAIALLKRTEQASPGSVGGILGRINASGDRVVVIGRDQTGTINVGDFAIYATPTRDPRERRDRVRMLQRVRRTWIDGFLEDSLHGAALEALGLQERPEAVPDRWGMVVQQPDRPAQELPPDTRIVQVFDDWDGELLILGEPGSGKTTLLLELTRALLDRAEHDEALPMPMVFPLAPWAAKQLPLADWLVDELNQRYDVPRQIGRAWIANDAILPLLDGLDEVAADHRAACVRAINAYQESRTKVLPGLVVTSRVADYDALRTQLRLRGAVLLQPLRPDQIDAYLASAGQQLAGVRAALQADATLRELAASPLLLSTMTLAYRGVPAELVPIIGTPEERRTHLFATYVEQMFTRRSVTTHYPRQQTLHWLGWLANALAQQGQTVFYVERLQPEWLPTRGLRLVYTVLDRAGGAVLAGAATGVLLGLLVAVFLGLWSVLDRLPMHIAQRFSAPPIIGTEREVLPIAFLYGALAGGLFGGQSEQRTGWGKRLGLGLRNALAGALLGGAGAAAMGFGFGAGAGQVGIGAFLGATLGALTGPPGLGPRRITPADTVRWVPGRGFSASAAGAGFAGGATMLIGAPLTSPPYGSWEALLALALVVALIGGFLAAVGGGFVGGEVEDKLVPNQGIRRSARRALVVGSAAGFGGAVIGLAAMSAVIGVFAVVGSMTGVAMSRPGWIEDTALPLAVGGAILGVVVSAAVAPGLALSMGGYACLSHAALRGVLWRSDCLALDSVSFLDYATQRVFLRKVGGGYMFVHRMLQEHFAAQHPA